MSQIARPIFDLGFSLPGTIGPGEIDNSLRIAQSHLDKIDDGILAPIDETLRKAMDTGIATDRDVLAAQDRYLGEQQRAIARLDARVNGRLDNQMRRIMQGSTQFGVTVPTQAQMVDIMSGRPPAGYPQFGAVLELLPCRRMHRFEFMDPKIPVGDESAEEIWLVRLNSGELGILKARWHPYGTRDNCVDTRYWRTVRGLFRTADEAKRWSQQPSGSGGKPMPTTDPLSIYPANRGESLGVLSYLIDEAFVRQLTQQNVVPIKLRPRIPGA